MKPLVIMSVVSLLVLLLMSVAEAETFKCINAAGKVSYSEKKEANAQCSPVTTPINVMPVPSAVYPSSGPSASGAKRDPLADQIAQQEHALAEAKKALAEQESIRLGSEKNYQRVLDRLKPYQDKVAGIEKQLAQLRAEQRKAR
jgi:Domain of unknown function (DUF4124)